MKAKREKNSSGKGRLRFAAAAAAAVLLTAAFTGCASVPADSESGTDSETVSSDSFDTGVIDTTFKKEDLDAAESGASSRIVFSGSEISYDSSKAGVSGDDLVIAAAGTYTLSGTRQGGSVIVNAGKDATVSLILDGFSITSPDGPGIYVMSADKVIITLAAGSTNSVTDPADYTFAGTDTSEPDAAIFSKSDLTINGSGTLIVNGNYKHGIVSKDDLVITGGTIRVHAVSDGVRGRDSVTSTGAFLTIVAGSDGIQSNNDEDTDKGYIYIDGGTYDITAGNDGIQAQNALWIKSGTIGITAGGGSGSGSGSQKSSDSSKGLKAAYDVLIDDGSITIDSKDDAIHSNGSIIIGGGTFAISSGDDAIHADSHIAIHGGGITIASCYEGIESADILIAGGTICVTSSDDGLNTAGGTGNTAGFGGMGGGGGGMNADDGSTFAMTGGCLYLNSGGDGFDVNGDAVLSGGTILVSGPTADDNGAIDYNGSFKVTGGTVIAAGSSGMAQAPDTSSTQYSVLIYLTARQEVGTIISIRNSTGESILAFAPAKYYTSLAFSSAALQKGETYTVYVGGTASGTVVNGLYTGGTCTGGTETAEFTVSSIVTTSGSGGMGGGGGQPPPGGGGGRR